jgi:hypothetical protein
MRGVYVRRRNSMDFGAGLGFCLAVLFVWIVSAVYKFTTNAGLAERVITLQAGETFVGVIERGRRRYIFIGHDWRKYQEHLSPDEIRLLKQEWY